MIYQKKVVSEEEENKFRIEVKSLAKYVYDTYNKLINWNPEQTLESYDGSTPYFDSLIKSLSK